jgi:probable HAF family extracellular repeat protein
MVWLVGLAWLAPAPAVAQSFPYTLTDLGVTGPFDTSRARAISNTGIVVGTLSDSTFVELNRAFRWENGVMTVINPLSSGTFTDGTAVNGNGIAVGNTDFNDGAGGSFLRGYYHSSGSLTLINPYTNGGSGTLNTANAINSNGVVAGSSDTADSTSSRAYTYHIGSGSYTLLPYFAGETVLYSDALGISDSGYVVGVGFITSSSFAFRAFRWKDPDAALTPIPVLPDIGGGGNEPEFWNAARAVNEAGVTVGYSDVELTGNPDNRTRAYRWDGTTLTDLGVLGTDLNSDAMGINNLDQIVGSSFSIDPNTFAKINEKAFIYGYAGDPNVMVDLNTLIDPSLGWTLQAALAINDNGWIVGYGLDGSGNTHAFLLTPAVIPEPTALALGGITILAASAAWWRRRRARLEAAAETEPDSDLDADPDQPTI